MANKLMGFLQVGDDNYEMVDVEARQSITELTSSDIKYVDGQNRTVKDILDLNSRKISNIHYTEYIYDNSGQTPTTSIEVANGASKTLTYEGVWSSLFIHSAKKPSSGTPDTYFINYSDKYTQHKTSYLHYEDSTHFGLFTLEFAYASDNTYSVKITNNSGMDLIFGLILSDKIIYS